MRSSDRPRRRSWLVGIVGASVVAAGFGAYWFAPWKLVIDESVAEARPAMRLYGSGAFRGLEHPTSGRAELFGDDGGPRTLHLADLATSNGPELVVMLSETPATEDSWTAYDDGAHVFLGPLKGNLGDQNYDIPGDVDVTKLKSVVVWCKRFDVAFGVAGLE